MYIFSGSDDRVGQRLEGVRILIDRYRSAGLSSIAHDFYSGAGTKCRTKQIVAM